MIKRYILFPILLVALASCESTTYEDIQDNTVIDGDVTYNANVKTIIDANCVSCHTPGGSASFRPLSTYTQVKDAVENAGLLDRIQRQNGEDGAMPQSGRMPQSTIDIILEWENDGLLEN
ncbi:cytochrome c [Flavobacterium sp. RHBU_24]|uniref:cytochrome c n=1 Tax=Flavobacterium sp. RHBU_24 TaxID=3391185 RepID=UPI0039847591